MASPRPGKMTLIEMVQNILISLNNDEVNSISDTVDAYDTARVIEETYYEILGGIENSLRVSAFQLQALSDPAKPNYFKIPDNVKQIKTLYYNIRTDSKDTYKEVLYIDPEEFVKRSLDRASNSDVTAVEDFSGATFYITNNEDPIYFTTFDDKYLIFDSWDNSKETTLQEHKTLGMGYIVPSFEMDDTFIPDLPADLFPYLLSEAKQTVFVNEKGVSNSREQQKSRRQKVRQQNNQHRSRTNSYEGPDYGRKTSR